jgi:hypothetical protein
VLLNPFVRLGVAAVAVALACVGSALAASASPDKKGAMSASLACANYIVDEDGVDLGRLCGRRAHALSLVGS